MASDQLLFNTHQILLIVFHESSLILDFTLVFNDRIRVQVIYSVNSIVILLLWLLLLQLLLFLLISSFYLYKSTYVIFGVL